MPARLSSVSGVTISSPVTASSKDARCTILSLSRDETAANSVVEEITAFGGEGVPHFGDVAVWDDARAMIGTAVEKFGDLNIIVNNAGILRDRMIFNMSEDDWDSVVAVHLKGTFNMCRHASEYWREEHKKGNLLNGRIINTASDAGLLGNVGQTNYGACKAAVATMAIIIGHEMKKYGVTANAIAPVARTRLTDDATPSTAALMGGDVKAGEFDVWGPQNIAPLVAWLASDDAAGCNGQVFRVGGRTVGFLLDQSGGVALGHELGALDGDRHHAGQRVDCPDVERGGDSGEQADGPGAVAKRHE